MLRILLIIYMEVSKNLGFEQEDIKSDLLNISKTLSLWLSLDCRIIWKGLCLTISLVAGTHPTVGSNDSWQEGPKDSSGTVPVWKQVCEDNSLLAALSPVHHVEQSTLSKLLS